MRNMTYVFFFSSLDSTLFSQEEKRQAKEEKKRGKKDNKYFSLLCDNNKTDSKSKK